MGRADNHLTQLRERFEQVDWQREYRGGIMLGGDLGEGLQVAKLERNRAVAHDFSGLGQPLRGLVFALCRNNLGATIALGFGLHADRALHVLRQVDVFQFDQ